MPLNMPLTSFQSSNPSLKPLICEYRGYIQCYRLKCCIDQGIYLAIINGQWTKICPTSSAVALTVYTVVVMRPFCGCFTADCIDLSNRP